MIVMEKGCQWGLHQSDNRVQQQALLNMITNFQVSQKVKFRNLSVTVLMDPAPCCSLVTYSYSKQLKPHLHPENTKPKNLSILTWNMRLVCIWNLIQYKKLLCSKNSMEEMRYPVLVHMIYWHASNNKYCKIKQTKLDIYSPWTGLQFLALSASWLLLPLPCLYL
jgi:hypothetical protein